jgi:acetyl-CoA acyltransferase
MSKHDHAVIVGYVRSPFTKAAVPGTGKEPGKLAHVDPVDMIVPLINEIMKRTGANAADIENILMGCVHQEDSQGLNIGRMVVMHKGVTLPLTVQGETLDKFCGSSMRTIAIAKNDVLAGEGKIILAGGVQSMSRVPMGGWNPSLNKNIHDGNVAGFMNMGLTAENLAVKYGVSRAEQDSFAVASHQKMAAAQKAGHLAGEIVAISGITEDDGVRADTSVEALAKLKPNFKNEDKGGTVTPASSSQITDGASLVMVSTESYAKTNNLPVLARIISYSGSGCAPEIMGIGPVEASKKALERAGITMADIDAVELNEAFAAQSIAVLKEMDAQGMHIDPAKLNVDGGAIAIGHPLGASGARLVGHLATVLERTGGRYGLATMCIGGGMGVAMVIENPHYDKDKAANKKDGHSCCAHSPKP